MTVTIIAAIATSPRPTRRSNRAPDAKDHILLADDAAGGESPLIDIMRSTPISGLHLRPEPAAGGLST